MKYDILNEGTNRVKRHICLVAAIFIALCFFSPAAGYTQKVLPNKSEGSGPQSFPHLVIITDQSQNRILITDVDTKKTVWEWKAEDGGIRLQDRNTLDVPSDAKSVLNGNYILVTASKGGIALIRISDKKAVFYAFAGGNTHSAAMLPDSNIVSASSTGNYLMVFRRDARSPDPVYKKKIFLPFAHNVVWDNKRQVLWSAGKNKLYSFRYNFNAANPDLTVIDSAEIPDDDAHDLFPVYGKDLLYLTTPEGIYQVDPTDKKTITVPGYYTKNIKSASGGPPGFPEIYLIPKEKWWTDEILDRAGNSVFKSEGLKIYKARWLLPNLFSGDDAKAFKIF